MIPQRMKEILTASVPEDRWDSRLIKDGTKRYMEFTALDVELLLGLGIKVDRLGPRLVVCMWDEANDIEIGGYLVVDNLAMGTPSMGGIRMLPDITPLAVYNLARGMTLKNAAADLPFGGGKSGICADNQCLTAEERTVVVRTFGRLLHRYRDIYNPGPDVGTADADMRLIAIENGLDCVLSKPSDMGGNRIDQLGAAARGVVLALRAVLERVERLRVLPQFSDLDVPRGEDLSLLIQGFGAVGAHTARLLGEIFPDSTPSLVGLSDARGALFAPGGLPRDELFRMWEGATDRERNVTRPYLRRWVEGQVDEHQLSFAQDANSLLREDAFCLVPAAPVANYLGLDESTNPSVTVDRMGGWRIVVEGANTYSPDPELKLRRHRLERVVYGERGVLIVTDYLVNAGGVVYAAHERLIPTPAHLQIPPERLGNADAVDAWLHEHRHDFAELAEQRRVAARAKLDEVIAHNMEELVESLSQDEARLPWEAAQQIAVGRIYSQEKGRTARDVMEPIATISPRATVVEAGQLLMSAHLNIVAVVSDDGALVGVVTDRDITRSVAATQCADTTVEFIMTDEVVTVGPETSILECVRKLESFQISATPVVDGQQVLGVVSGDLLATRTLFRLLQTEPGLMSELSLSSIER
jgi:glutamate dehydrogenase (NAD(P)+)